MKSSLLTEIQLFLTRHAQQERKLSRATILSYRDTLKLFIIFQRDRRHCTPARLDIGCLAYETILAFLDYLEKERGAKVTTRNQRLAALRSLCRYVLFRHPESADMLSRSLMVPMKKRSKKLRSFLETSEISALLGAVNRKTWIGRRDHLMLDLAIRTGLRVSELVALGPGNFKFGRTPYLTVEGKGRKERSVPLDKPTAKAISHWISTELDPGHLCVFPTIAGKPMSVDSVQHLVHKYAKIAADKIPSLRKKRISPHTLRHTTAMQMLSRGVDVEIIALWLGHEQIDTTHIYFSESLAIKRKALKRTRFRAEVRPPANPSCELSFLDDV